jgi:hypothetical protein
LSYILEENLTVLSDGLDVADEAKGGVMEELHELDP